MRGKRAKALAKAAHEKTTNFSRVAYVRRSSDGAVIAARGTERAINQALKKAWKGRKR